MAKRYDITNCDAKSRTIMIGLRKIPFGSTSYAVPESEITEGVKKLEKAKVIRIVPSIGKKPKAHASLVKNIESKKQEVEKVKPATPVTDAAELPKFPWVTYEYVAKVIHNEAIDELPLAIESTEPTESTEPIEEVVESNDAEIESADMVEIEVPVNDSSAIEAPTPKRRRRRK